MDRELGAFIGLDTPTMARGKQRQAQSLGVHFIAWIFLGVMVFSLGYYERGEKSWADATTYQVQAQEIAFGAPHPWLHYNTVSMNGAPPPIEMLPGGTSFLPGAHVDVVNLCLAASVAFLIALVLFILSWMAWPDMQRKGETPSATALFAIASSSSVVGAVTPTDPVWIGAVLGLAVVPAIIAGVCWRRGGFASIVLCSAIGVLCLVWVQRVTALFWARFGDHAFGLREYMVTPSAMFAVYVLVVMAVVTVKRLVAR